MYTVNNEKNIKKRKVTDLINVDGFLMNSKSKKFVIDGQNITSIKITDKKLASPLVAKTVSKKYKKLINLLTKLLTSDDDTGETFNIALNEIEKFRQEIKNNYRFYLEKKELEYMAKQLTILQKEAKSKYNELCSNFNNNKIGKSR